jgi:hypothetical protein
MDIKLTCAAHGLEERMVRCRGFLADSLSDVRLEVPACDALYWKKLREFW